MNVLQYQDTVTSPNLQIWNNAAFDDGNGVEPPIKNSSFSLQSFPLNRSETLESDPCKENRVPAFSKSPISAPTKRSSQGKKPLKLLSNQEYLSPPPKADERKIDTEIELLSKQEYLSPPRKADERKIDTEIEEIEKEIDLLSSRLQALRIEKAEMDSKMVGKRNVGRIVPAKFMEPKQSCKTSAAKKMKESPSGTKFWRKGASFGPSEASTGVRFGPETTPLNRRRSCFVKLSEIDEETKRKKQRGRSLSLSPKSGPSVAKVYGRKWEISTVGSKELIKRDDMTLVTVHPKKLFNGPKSGPSVAKVCGQRWEISTVGSKKPIKRDDMTSASVQPKKLFSEKKPKKEKVRNRSLSPQSRPSIAVVSGRKRGISTVRSKKPLKKDQKMLKCLESTKLFQEEEKSTPLVSRKSRVVPSRYNQTPVLSRKRSFPENDKRREEKRRMVLSFSGRKSAPGRSVLVESSQSSILKMAQLLPKIKTVCYENESPRDSGCAKRVSDLIGTKSYFVEDEEICRAFDFEDELNQGGGSAV